MCHLLFLHSFGMVHFFTSCGSPRTSHFLPPAFGGGLVQVLNRCCVPLPHVLLHLVQVVHRVYPPSIAVCRDKEIKKTYAKFIVDLHVKILALLKCP